MIEKEYSVRFVKKLINLTEQGKIFWMTLPKYFEANDNEPLRKEVIANNQYAYSFHKIDHVGLVNEYKSYCSIINDGVVTLFSKQRGNDTVLDISIQTDSSHYLQRLSCDDEVDALLKDLLLQLSLKMDDGLKFIKSVIDM